MKTPSIIFICCFLLAQLFSPVTAIAQLDFKPGFVITLQQDTLHGLLKEKLTRYGFDIIFKKSEAAEEETIYPPLMLKECYFSSTGELFESHRIEIKFIKLPMAEKAVFFKKLIGGRVSLYLYNDANQKKRFYIKKEEIGLRELYITFKEGLEENTGQRYKKEVNTFQGELKLALKECPTVFPLVDNTPLLEKALKKCVLQYYQCTNQDYIEYRRKKREKLKNEIGLRFGVNQSSSFFPEQGGTLFTDGGSGNQLGLFFNFYLPNAKYRYSIELGMVWFRVVSEDPNREEDLVGGFAIPIRLYRYVVLGKSRINVNLGFDINLNFEENLPAFAGGIGYDYKIKQTRLSINGGVHVRKNPFFTVDLGVFF